MNKTAKKALKWSGIVLGFIILMMILLPFIFRKQIVQAVKDETNKSLNAVVDFKDYSLNLFCSFPNFQLGLEDLTVVGIGEFKDDTLVKMDQLQVSVNLFSVISGETYTIRKIQLDHPIAHLKVLPGGKASWDIMKPSADSTTAAEEPSKFKLSLQKLVISNARIVYDDYDSQIFVKIDSMDHTLSGDFSADFTDLSTETDIRSLSYTYEGITYLNKAKLAMEADVDADLKNYKYTIKETELSVNELLLTFEGWFAMPDSTYDMDLKFSAPKTDFKNILSLVPAVYMTGFENIKSSGTLALNGFVKGKYDDNGLPAFEVILKVDNGMFQYPDLPKAVTNIGIDAKISNIGGSEDNTIINVKKLHLEMGGVPVDGSLYVSTPVSDPNIDAKLKGKMDLSKVIEYYPLGKDEQLSGLFTADIAVKGRMSYIDKEEYEKFDAKGNMMVENFVYKSPDVPEGTSISKAELQFTPQALDLISFAAKTGKSDMNAKGKVENYLAYFFRDELLKGTFSLTSSLIDLNGFMSDEETTTTKESSAMSVIEMPGNIDFTLNTDIKKVLYDKIEITNVKGQLGLKDRTAVMKDLSMNMLDGALNLGGSYGTQNPLAPKLALILDISKFDIQQTLKNFPSLGKFAPIAEKASGKFSAKLDYASVLKTDMTPDYGSVNAAGALQTHGITISNAGFFNKLSDELKINLFRSLTPSDLNLSFKIVNGSVFTNPFDIKLSKSVLNVEGFTKLDETIQYVMKLSVPRSEFGGAANSVLNNLTSQATAKGIEINPGETVNIDILATGTVTKPVFKIGLKGSLGNLADDLKDQAKQALEEKKEEIIQEAKETVNQALEDANKKAQQLISEAETKAQQIRVEAKNAGDKLIAEAETQGQKLIADAKNPLTKAAAKETAKQLKTEAQKKADKLNAEADKQATDLVNKARAEGDKLINAAKQ